MEVFEEISEFFGLAQTIARSTNVKSLKKCMNLFGGTKKKHEYIGNNQKNSVNFYGIFKRLWVNCCSFDGFLCSFSPDVQRLKTLNIGPSFTDFVISYATNTWNKFYQTNLNVTTRNWIIYL